MNKNFGEELSKGIVTEDELIKTEQNNDLLYVSGINDLSVPE